jgi:hypothetical protein
MYTMNSNLYIIIYILALRSYLNDSCSHSVVLRNCVTTILLNWIYGCGLYNKKRPWRWLTIDAVNNTVAVNIIIEFKRDVADCIYDFF